MLSIGEFSKICSVSAKTLRYYAEIGLIYPDKINPGNGYRYYSLEQLKKMLFINRLKSYEFSLEDIKTILEETENQQSERLYTVLNHKKIQMQDRISMIENSMKQLDKDILSLERGSSIMSYLDTIDVHLTDKPSTTILFSRKIVSVEECAEGYCNYYDKLFRTIALQKLTIAGSPITIYHSPEYSPIEYDIEFAIPIKEVVTGTRDFSPGLCVKTVVKGPYSELPSIYARQREWIEKEGYEFVKSPFDVYVNDPTQVCSSDKLITESYYPVKKK